MPQDLGADSAGRGPGQRIVVVGQIARDLVLRVDELPGVGASSRIDERREMLGGKGANQAVGLRQLLAADGAEVALVGVVGEDAAGDAVLADAAADGLDVDVVVRRGRTPLLIDIVTADGGRRLLEDVPHSALLTAEDIRGAEAAFADADAVVLQLQQPVGAVLAAAALGRDTGALVVIDGELPARARAQLLAMADVVRADAREAASFAGIPIADRQDAARAARSLVNARTKVVALEVPGEGDLVVWAHGELFLPHGERTPVDPTGAGDAFTAGLTAALVRGDDVATAARAAAVAAADTVRRLGGRPDLSRRTEGRRS